MHLFCKNNPGKEMGESEEGGPEPPSKKRKSGGADDEGRETEKSIQKKVLKKSKRERKRSDPTLLLNLSYLLELAKQKVVEARHPPSPPISSTTVKSTVFNWRSIRRAQSLIKDMRELAKKSVHRLPREVKRQFCKKCNVYLLPSVTAECRVMTGDGDKFLQIKCTLCKKIKKFILKRGVKAKKKRKNRREEPNSAATVSLSGDQSMVL